jgi:tRNA-intron endonuclease
MSSRSSSRRIVVKLEGSEAYPLSGADELAQMLGLKPPLASVSLSDLLLLAMDSLVTVVDEQGRELSIEELVARAVRYNPLAWVRAEVYRDLKRRGRIVVPGPREDTLLVKLRKKSPNFDYYVLVLEERRPVKLSTIVSFIEESTRNGWTPLIAVVDDYGDVTYYTPSLFTPRRRG